MALSRSLSFAALLPVSLAVMSCDAETTNDDGKVEDPVDTAVETAEYIAYTTPDFTVPTGDSFTCFYTKYTTEAELAIIAGDGVQGPGGHHILAYYAEDARPVGYHACEDQEMVNLKQIAGSAGDGGQVLGLPAGLAVRVPKGKQLVVQAHYINTSGAEMKVHDTVKIVKGTGAQVKEFVNYLVTNDEGFEIAPNTPFAHTTECTLERDFQMAINVPHMHELGAHFTLDVVGVDGNVRDHLVDTDWQPSYASHPPIGAYDMSAPYLLKKGEKLRQTCAWQNSTTDPVIFPREMCLTFFYYWPGEGDLECDMKPVAP